MMEAWRSMEPGDRQEFLVWAESSLFKRWVLGDERYESCTLGFQGDPLDHAIEEALDLVLYLWIAKRRQGVE